MLVLTAVSSINNSRAGSSMPCSRIQRRCARATSARCRSAACRLFFTGDVVPTKKRESALLLVRIRRLSSSTSVSFKVRSGRSATRANIDAARCSNEDEQCGYRGGVLAQDRVVTATDGSQIVGVARLCREEGVTVLRGMEIAPAYQRKGIGSRMLGELDNLIGKGACWGIARAHLDSFYGRIGFYFVDETQAPEHLRARLHSYRKSNHVPSFSALAAICAHHTRHHNGHDDRLDVTPHLLGRLCMG